MQVLGKAIVYFSTHFQLQIDQANTKHHAIYINHSSNEIIINLFLTVLFV